jgi:ferredoxin-NADP reductase
MLIDPYSWNTVRITNIVRESPDAVTLVTELPTDYTFRPGQHAIVRVTLKDGTQRLRQYSFAHAPHENELCFTITRSPGGEVSSWSIDHATTKSTIDVSQPFTGPLDHDLSTYRSIGMIAGGSGIVTIMSHLRTLRYAQSSTHISLMYSTVSDQKCYISELVDSNTNEHILVRLTDTQLRFSRSEIVEHMKDCDVILLCGSRKFVTALQSICHETFPDTPTLAEAFSLL